MFKTDYNLLNLTAEVYPQGTADEEPFTKLRWLADGTKAGYTLFFGAFSLEYLGSLKYLRDGDEITLFDASFGGGRILISQGADGNIYTPNYYSTDHLGSTRAIVADGYVTEAINYYPYGSQWEPSAYLSGMNLHYFNGKEAFYDALDYGARMYVPTVPRWTAIDPLAEKYYSISPYAYCANNPVNIIDPDGKDGYLVIWLTADGNIGHAGFAIDNYRQQQIFDNKGNAILDSNGNPTYKMVKDGTVTYMDLWPGNEEGVGRSNVGTDVIAYYGVTTTTVDDILNTDISGQERGLAPQGVIQISTNYESDMKTMQSMTEFMQTNIYNGRDRNCSDFAKLGVEMSLGNKINAQENILFKKSTTPNALIGLRLLKTILLF